MKHSCDTYISVGIEVSNCVAKVLSMSSNAIQNIVWNFTLEISVNFIVHLSFWLKSENGKMGARIFAHISSKSCG